MATGDTKTESYLRIAAEGERDDLPTDNCCNTKTQNLILGVANRVMNVEDEVKELKNNPDVVDIVGTYEDLQAYDTSTLTDKDVIRVLEDSTHDDKSTFYRWNASTSQFDYIGEAGGGGPNVVQTIGFSTEDVMSQAATTKLVYQGGTHPLAIRMGTEDESTYDDTISIGLMSKVTGQGGISIGSNASCTNSTIAPLAIGYQASASATNTIAIGTQANVPANCDNSIAIGNSAKTTNYNTITIGTQTVKSPCSIAIGGANNSSYGVASNAKGAVAIGFNSHATRAGEVNIGDSVNRIYGFNNSAYRVIGGVYDGQEPHDAATVGQLDGRVKQNAGAPTTATVGTVGQLLEDTTNGKLYQCTAVDTTDPNNPSYTWSEVGGGGGVTVVQTTGSSTTDVMSQNAVTNMFYSGNNAVIAPDSNTLGSITIGRNDTTAYGNAFNIGIGNGASAWTPGSVSLGYNAINYYGGEYGVALGWLSAVAGTASHSVALGDTARATRTGEVNVGSYGYNHGYNNSANRVIGGVYDGQELNDAATVAQGNTLATSAPTTSTVGVLGQLYTDTTGMHTYQCTAISGSTYTWTQRW